MLGGALLRQWPSGLAGGVLTKNATPISEDEMVKSGQHQ